MTDAREQYIVSGKTMGQRYRPSKALNDDWVEYLPLGEVRAIVVDQSLISRLNKAESFFITASWGSSQRVELGDFLVTPLPSENEIYRVGKKEFEQTYRLVS